MILLVKPNLIAKRWEIGIYKSSYITNIPANGFWLHHLWGHQHSSALWFALVWQLQKQPKLSISNYSNISNTTIRTYYIFIITKKRTYYILRYSQSAPPSCWRACKKRLCKSCDQHLRSFLCPSFRDFSSAGSTALELVATTGVEEGVLLNDSLGFEPFSSLWSGWKAPPPLPLLFSSTPHTILLTSWTIFHGKIEFRHT